MKKLKWEDHLESYCCHTGKTHALESSNGKEDGECPCLNPSCNRKLTFFPTLLDYARTGKKYKVFSQFVILGENQVKLKFQSVLENSLEICSHHYMRPQNLQNKTKKKVLSLKNSATAKLCFQPNKTWIHTGYSNTTK